jgi:transposase
MPNPYPIELRERAVRAYEDSTDTYGEVAARFGIAVSTLCLWIRKARDTGQVMPAPKGGGWYSPVDIGLLHRLVRERPDRTTEEVTRAYNRRVAPEVRVHRSSILRALQRTGFVFKKNDRGQRNWTGPRSRPSGAPSGVGFAR